jgi:hypothetical protein
MKFLEKKKINEDEKITWKQFVQQFKKFPHQKAGEYKFDIPGAVSFQGTNVSLELKGTSIVLDRKITIRPNDGSYTTLYEDYNYGIKIQDLKADFTLYIFYTS